MKYFGTDGIRGKVNKKITLDLVNKVGLGLSQVLHKKYGDKKITIVIATDTRISKDFIKYGLISHLNAYGIDVVDLGVFPTPSVSYITEKFENIYAGIMISASHNPYMDNGIKIFDANGKKLVNESEEEIERVISGEEELTIKLPSDDSLGIIIDESNEYKDSYIDHLVSSVDIEKIKGMNIAIDSAFGATSNVARTIFNRLKANVSIINWEYNGVNINDNAGSMHPNVLSEYVKKNNFDIAYAYDGDGDRCIAVDNKGNILDGDDQLYILSLKMKETNELLNNTVVTTVMTSLAFDKTLNEKGINVVRTDVGDKYVAEEMHENSYNLGGEQSGHIIYKKYANTGDGILTSLQLSEYLSSNDANKIVSGLKRYPQTLINVKVKNKEISMNNSDFLDEIKKEELKMKGTGRILIRASGTEELIRVLVENEDEEISKNVAKKLSLLL